MKTVFALWRESWAAVEQYLPAYISELSPFWYFFSQEKVHCVSNGLSVAGQ